MLNIPYDFLELDKERGKPCYFDSRNVHYSQQEVICFCSDERQRYMKLDKMIKCTKCNKLSHEACAGFNAKMRNYMCATC